MAENGSKSKLKRKRSSVEEPKSELGSRGTAERSGAAPPSRGGAAHPDRCRPPAAAAAWWNVLRPPAVESLWAFTLMSALPHLQNQLWDPVPDLPLPPAARPATPEVEEQWTIDLFSDAPPFPEDGPLTQGLPSDPQSASSPQEIAPVQTRPSGESPDKGPSSDSRQSPEQQAEPPGSLSRTQNWEKPAPSSAGEPRVGPLSRRLLAESLKVSNPPVSPCGEEEEKTVVVQNASKHEVGALESCPMCLHVFPSGFTQTEQDGHLAQCLSELSVDMTW
ncbi:Fanconi anemia core complex-associated protein 20 [Xiphophorus couchianus]|uniref:Fanconi anemia core complex-associated protein 20 n=1 Tax=Xiphophorus couchianus TaxID=32473 RepID=UPI001016DC57|nr:Fanconi anemia core complex-associated protein 20 [Xiphophorus couchianus]